jgi:hypothetical protein
LGDLEKDLAQLEKLLRRLEKEYEQFLCGVLRREPTDTENAVLALVRGWANRAIQNPTLAFRFNSLVARYNAFRTVWSRRLREREEGQLAARGRRPGGARAPQDAGARPAPPAHAEPTEYLAVDPHHETRRLQQFFLAYRALRKECGEPSDRLRAESFEKAITDKVEKIKKSQTCDAVLIRLVKEAGKVRIVARPFRRPAAGEASP